MKIALINDTHAGARGDSLLFNEFFFKFWENVFFPYLKEHGIQHICHLGDFVDRRKFINYTILNSWRKRFFDKMIEQNITMDVIVGNHDVTYKNTNEINALHELFDSYNNVNVYIDPVEKEYDGVNVSLIPWINSSNYQSSLEFLKTTKSQIIFGHFEISGFEMDRGNICHEGMSPETFNRFDIVLSGHFHHKSSKGNITYLGNQYEMTWADCGDQRGFHVFDTETRELEFIPNVYKMFHKMYYDDKTQNFEFWKSHDYEQYKDSYVKIVVMNKENPYMFETILDNLYKIGIADVSIVEDFTETKDDAADVDQAEDTITIINKYIDGLTINVQPDKLKTLIKEIYVESLNAEQNE